MIGADQKEVQPVALPSPPIAGPRDTRSVALDVVRATRPKQWVKNLLVLAAPGAAGVLTRTSAIERTAAAFAAFCLVSGAMYLVNDIADAESDRRDPRKRDRPIAAGLVPQPVALTAAAILVAVGAAIGFPLGIRFEAALTLYACLTVSYSLWLKEVAVIDIGIVSSGFLIRAIAGGLAVHVPVSEWFLILISFGSLLIVAGKREADLAAALSHAEPGDGADIEAVPGVAPSLAARRGQAPLPRRPQEYSLAYLRFVWMMASAVSIAGYCLWAFSMPHLRADVPWAELSIIPFVLAILRYGLLLDAGVGGEPEEVILRDRPLQLLAVAWLVVYTLGVYLGR